ncbi:hypothetical protein Tco_1113848 [Tanacetum coccineum]|uniref:Uncharacterized protein n=1 Tax=Tanacetum coccineum TaxID=301880 RepID=A0ABQ5ITE4_9ASTR
MGENNETSSSRGCLGVTIVMEKGYGKAMHSDKKTKETQIWFKEIIASSNIRKLTDELDAFDSDCDETPGAKAVLMLIYPVMTQMLSQMYQS